MSIQRGGQSVCRNCRPLAHTLDLFACQSQSANRLPAAPPAPSTVLLSASQTMGRQLHRGCSGCSFSPTSEPNLALANPISNFACENPFYIWPRRPSSAQGFSVLIGSTDWFYAGLNIVCDANRVERRSHVTRLFRAGRASRIFDFSSKVAEWSKMLKTVLA